jgi:hypothetical protein
VHKRFCPEGAGGGRGGRGEVAKTMYTHISTYKSNTIEKRTNNILSFTQIREIILLCVLVYS